MKETELKYGCNPNQKPARVFMKSGDLPFSVLNGKPGYINLLDALNAWQLVTELKRATGLASAASFKHVSPAGVGMAVPLDDVMKKIYFVEQNEISEIATAYIRARGADRMSSYGDFIALSEECDASCARYIAKEVSDGIIAPGYTPEALEILKGKRKGGYLVMKMVTDYRPEPIEQKQVYGVTFEQGRNEIDITPKMFKNIVSQNKDLPECAIRDLVISMITLKYTQSNSVCYVKGGQAIGIGAGQQSRVHCTRLAGNKADNWYLRQHEKVLSLPFLDNVRRPDRDNAIDVYISDFTDDVRRDGAWQRVFKTQPESFSEKEKEAWLKTQKGVALGSDAFFPFGDNIERAYKSGVQYVAEAGGSIRDDDVIATCDRYGMTLSFTGVRLFHH